MIVNAHKILGMGSVLLSEKYYGRNARTAKP
jgi:hypothetical protein